MGLFSRLLIASAVVIAAVVRLYPELLLRIPHYGFTLWAMTGNPVPPFLDNDIFTSNDPPTASWLKDGDVVVSVCGKCGTNWMLTIVHELRTWDKPHLQEFSDILDITPWPEMMHYPRETRQQRIDNWGTVWNNTQFPFKAYKTHFSPDKLPVRERSGVKFLVMARNPQDALVSASEFFAKHSDEMRKMWGGFPPKSFGTIDSLVDSAVNGDYLNMFGFLKQWLPYREDKNVLLLHYSDVFKDQKKYIKLIADFIGVKDITEKGLKEVEKRVSVAFMKDRNDKYLYKVGDFTILTAGSDAIINKGGDRGAKKVMSKQQIDAVNEAMTKIMGKDLALIAKQGFENSK